MSDSAPRSMPDRVAPSGGTDVRHDSDLATHPDAAEMSERYARILQGPPAVAVDGLILLAGLYAAVSPWVVHFQTTNPAMTANNLIIGLALACLGMGMALRPERMFPLGWVASVIGVWLIISPWIISLGHHAPKTLIWTNAVTGGVAFVLGLAAMGMIGATSRRTHM